MKSWFFVLEICIFGGFIISLIQATYLKLVDDGPFKSKLFPRDEFTDPDSNINLKLDEIFQSNDEIFPSNDEVTFPYEAINTLDEQDPYKSIEDLEVFNDQTNLVSSPFDIALTSTTTTKKFSVPLINDGTDTFFVKVNIGGVDFLPLLSTGSCWYWVRGQECQSIPGDHSCDGRKYDSTQSKTSHETRETFIANYLIGKVACRVGIEKMQLGESLILNQQKFGISVFQQNYTPEGVFGLGPKCTAYPTIFDEIVKDRKGAVKPVFSINLIGKKPGQGQGQRLPGGELLLGGIMTEMIQGGAAGVVYPKMVAQNDWTVTLDDVLVDGKPVGLGSRSMAIDTGSTFIEMPEKDAVMIHSLFAPDAKRVKGYWIIKCDTKSIISFVFEGIKFPLRPRDMASQELEQNLCLSGIFSNSDPPNSPWLVGVPFLKNVISVYDTNKPQLGFGRKVKNGG
ncbi:hypothetical protein G9A89_014940 [Geosiphon pyriformis]|nr:hypothetical protein G9A89_014940 [Geosiphon pyriformis]